MRSRNAARMMQPPRQIDGDRAEVDVPVVLLGCRRRSRGSPARRRRSWTRTAPARPGLRTPRPRSGAGVLGPGRPRAARRRSAWPDSERAKTASAMPVTGTPRSSAIWTVQRPVPFCSAWSSTTSTNGLPVAGVDVGQDLGGDLDQVGVEPAGVPGRGRCRRSARASCRAPCAQQVVRLGDELHVGVLDAVVHHLDEVAGAVGADVGAARGSVRRLARRSSPASGRGTA